MREGSIGSVMVGLLERLFLDASDAAADESVGLFDLLAPPGEREVRHLEVRLRELLAGLDGAERLEPSHGGPARVAVAHDAVGRARVVDEADLAVERHALVRGEEPPRPIVDVAQTRFLRQWIHLLTLLLFVLRFVLLLFFVLLLLLILLVKLLPLLLLLRSLRLLLQLALRLSLERDREELRSDLLSPAREGRRLLCVRAQRARFHHRHLIEFDEAKETQEPVVGKPPLVERLEHLLCSVS
mmetsp:Transcript_30409/g.98859  ORF Transcript_30409/g.98859 Transcript_30409/m.98859 type:complete len:242 (-) Transcript_30409:309-1034(-)